MILNRTNTVLAILLAVSVMATIATRVDYTQPNFEILPDMKYTPAWTAYQPNPNFANGQTLQTPVTGTIARGQMPLHYEATKEGAERAGEELENPFAVGGGNEEQVLESEARLRESIRRGSDTFGIFCVSCHGATGAGDGPVAKRGFPPPPSLLTGNSVKMKDGQLFHILTFGQGSMSGFAGQLPRDGRWDVINYVRTLKPPAGEADGAEADGAEANQPNNDGAKSK